jgi:hypothetical protein
MNSALSLQEEEAQQATIKAQSSYFNSQRKSKAAADLLLDEDE